MKNMQNEICKADENDVHIRDKYKSNAIQHLMCGQWFNCCKFRRKCFLIWGLYFEKREK